jgi:hypothetical protein
LSRCKGVFVMFETINKGPGPGFDVETAKDEMHHQDLAIKMFYAPGKQPFYLENIVISNLYDLKVVLERIPTDEAHRLANWIRYLGDEVLAERLEQDPEDLRELVMQRYSDLASYFTNEGPGQDHRST